MQKLILASSIKNTNLSPDSMFNLDKDLDLEMINKDMWSITVYTLSRYKQ